MNYRQLGVVFLTLLMLGGCASNKAVDQQAEANDMGDPKDPYEDFNRAMWDFNYDILDEYILRPTAVAYRDYMPQVARTGLLNAALNLEEPGNTLNNLLQGKVGDSMTSLGRFVINSTIGLLGTIDVASNMGLQRKEEEFGETLGKWGVGTGPYLMLPAFGPSDPRSFTGDAVDSLYWPIGDMTLLWGLFRTGIEVLETRITLMDQEQLLEDSLDPYTFVKDAYWQNLEFRVNDGQIVDDEDEFEDDEELEELLDDI